MSHKFSLIMSGLFLSSKFTSLRCLVNNDCCVFAFSINDIKSKINDIQEWYKTEICDEVSKILETESAFCKNVKYISYHIYEHNFSESHTIDTLHSLIGLMQKHKVCFKYGTVLFNCLECGKLCYVGDLENITDVRDLRNGDGVTRLCVDCMSMETETYTDIPIKRELENEVQSSQIHFMQSVYMFCLKSILLEIRMEYCFCCYEGSEKAIEDSNNVKHYTPGGCKAPLDFYNMFFYISLALSQLSDELVCDVFKKSAIKKFGIALYENYTSIRNVLERVKRNFGQIVSHKYEQLPSDKISSIRNSIEPSERHFIEFIYALDTSQKIEDMEIIRESYYYSKCKCRMPCHITTCSCMQLKIPCSVHCHPKIICDHRFDQPKRKFRLPDTEIDILKSPSGWLTDNHIYVANSVLKRDYPAICGLQDTLNQNNLCIPTQSKAFVQFLLIRNNHWIIISNINAPVNSINVYDSSYRQMDQDTKALIQRYCRSDDITINILNVQQQQNCSDCGVYAIAFAKSLLCGEDPTRMIFCKPRDHLLHYLPQRQIPKFPTYYTKCSVKILHTIN